MYYHNKVNRVDNIDWRNPGSSGEKVKSDGNSAQQIREAAKLLRDLRYGQTIEKEHRTMEREDFADQPGVQVGSPMDILKDKENDKFEELKILQEILENFEGSEDEYKKLMGQYWPLAEELMKEFGTE